ncbi:MAG: gluconokinase [Gammaproteobacteria bacterium]|nr:MAG: gluconokinase [Gammaproteobacteria bacterium]
MDSNKTVSNPNATTFLAIIMGVSGSGKSTLAKVLADNYSFEYLDGDDFHSLESRSLMASGTPLTDAHRAPWVAAIKQRLQDNANHVTHTVLAFSGLKQKHREELRSAGLKTVFLYLDGDKEIIQDRINNRKGHFMAPTLLDSQFASMEDPLSEPDVHLINVRPGFERVSQQARAIIDEHFQSQESSTVL